MTVSDFEAVKKWNDISKEFRERLLSNVFCGKCYTTTIVNYSIKNGDGGILLVGECKTCGNSVRRFVED